MDEQISQTIRFGANYHDRDCSGMNSMLPLNPTINGQKYLKGHLLGKGQQFSVPFARQAQFGDCAALIPAK